MADVAMPNAISAWMQARNWGNHHLEWHVVRIWDRLPAAATQWATGQGWVRYAIQEGETGNGLQFLAMHRVMMQQLLAAFPQHAALFAGWSSPPTDPRDPNDPLPGNGTEPFNANMASAITSLHDDLALFPADDELGLYIETRFRPLPGQPSRQSSDPTTGIHNYIHGRFQDPNSPIDMGDPLVNLENQRFWRLHGWIDGRWTAFRLAKGLANDQPEYRSALEEAEQHMPHAHHPPAGSVILGVDEREAFPSLAVPAAIHTEILRVLTQGVTMQGQR